MSTILRSFHDESGNKKTKKFGSFTAMVVFSDNNYLKILKIINRWHEELIVDPKFSFLKDMGLHFSMIKKHLLGDNKKSENYEIFNNIIEEFWCGLLKSLKKFIFFRSRYTSKKYKSTDSFMEGIFYNINSIQLETMEKKFGKNLSKIILCYDKNNEVKKWDKKEILYDETLKKLKIYNTKEWEQKQIEFKFMQNSLFYAIPDFLCGIHKMIIEAINPFERNEHENLIFLLNKNNLRQGRASIIFSSDKSDASKINNLIKWT